MKRWLIGLLCLQVMMGGWSQAREMELGFPGLTHRVKVFLPDDRDESKRYPVLFYYHGAGGEPDTSWMRHHAGERDWIVVGMAYYRLGSVVYDEQGMAKQRHLLGSVKNHLVTKYGADAKRCYVSGFSKGGWMTDMLLQLDRSLAGGVILGAGHVVQMKSRPDRHPSKRPVYIGIGRRDPNYPFSLQGLVFHRKLGAQTMFESWPGVGHSMPEPGAEGLRQWLMVQAQLAAEVRVRAKSVMRGGIERSESMNAVARWQELRRLQKLPYHAFLNQVTQVDLAEVIKQLEGTEAVRRELEVEQKHRQLIRQEINANTLENMLQVWPRYLALAEQFPESEQAELIRYDYERTGRRIEHFRKQPAPAAKKPEVVTPEQPERKIDLPTNRRRVPGNPLIR